MSAPDNMPDDRPVTVADLEGDNDPLFVLAARVVTHLGGEWSARRLFTRDVMLLGPDDMKLCFTPYGDREYDPAWFYLATFTATGRQRERVPTDRLSLFTLPSQIAVHLAAEAIPAARQRMKRARKHQAKAQAKTRERNEARKARIVRIAQKLNWNATSYDCQSGDITPNMRHHRSRQRDPSGIALYGGHIGYDKNTIDMKIYLDGVPEDLMDQIVEVIAAYPRPLPEQLEPSSPKKKRNDMKIESIDNRGDDEVPFGYVYFDDGARTAYAKFTDEDTGDVEWKLSGPGSSHWKLPTARHDLMALTHLKEHGPKMPDDAAA